MNKYTIKPLRNNIIIDPFKVESEAGLVYTDNDRVEKATVVSVGWEVNGIEPGDIILYKNYSTDTIKDGDNEYIIIDASEVKALLYKNVCTTAPTE